MKNSLKYSDLWRKKREELPIDTEAQTGWQEMQSLLDLHLPVVPVSPAAPVSKLAKAIKAIKAMKATSLLVASLTVATVTGTAIYIAKIQQHKKSSHQHKSTKYAMRTDSLTDSLTTNESNINDSVGIVQDSLLDLNLPGNKKNISGNKDSLTNATGTNSSVVNGGIKTKGIVSTATGRQATSAILSNSSTNTTNGSLTRHSVYGSGRNPISGKYYNNAHNAGKGAAQSAITNALDTSTLSNVPDDLALNNNNLLTIPSTVSNNRIQSGPSTGINPLLFQPQIFARQPLSNFVVGNYYYNRLRTVNNGKTSKAKNPKVKNQSAKSAKTKNPGRSFGKSLSAAFSNTDWGILLGANTSGSFTPSAQNHNFYGSFPVDLYTGLFATYHINDKWGLNAQVRFLTPLNLSGTYTNQNDHVDSVKSIRVTDSRKAYFVTIPIHAVYKINDNISIKGGPVINVLAKQVSLNTSAQKMYLNVDTLFLQSKDNQVKTTTRYDQKVNIGLSGGISLQANRFIFEALYQKSLSGYNVTSDLHNYKNNPGSLQISIGFKLNGAKRH